MPEDAMEFLVNWPQVSRTERGAFVRTSCVLPSGSLLSVSVQPAIDGWIVSDEGSAAWEASSGGREVDGALAGLKAMLAQKGLKLHDGKIYSPRVSSGELPYMVAYLATATLDASRWLSSKVDKKKSETIVDVLPRHLRIKFPDFVMPEPLSLRGDTDKAYTFRNVLLLPSRQRLILDPVLRQDSSIKSRIVANIDVARAKHKNLAQHIVYDDAEDWTEAELALLTVGAPSVAYSNVDALVERLVA